MTNSFEIRNRNILSIYLYVLRLMMIISMMTGSLRCKKTAKVGCGDNGHFLDVTLLNGMEMNSIEFRIACKLYLGFPVCYLPHRKVI
jgi:hypothetical protein